MALGYREQDGPPQEELDGVDRRIFSLFFIANIVLVIWALVDAIKVPDDSMYRAGSKLIWVLVILFAGFIGRSCTSWSVGPPAGPPPRGRLRPLRINLPRHRAAPSRDVGGRWRCLELW